MKKIITAIVSLMMMVSMIGCGSDSIVGQWKATEGSLTIQFNNDGTCEIERTGTYQIINETTLTFKRDGYDYTDEYTYSLDGDTLVFEGITFERQ